MKQTETQPMVNVDIELFNFYDGIQPHTDRISSFMANELKMHTKDIAQTTINFSGKLEEGGLFYKPDTRTATVLLDFLGISGLAKELSVHGYMDNNTREETSTLLSQQFSSVTASALATAAHYEKVRRTRKKVETVAALGSSLLALGVSVSHNWYFLPVIPTPTLLAHYSGQNMRRNSYQVFDKSTTPQPGQDLISLFLRRQ